MTRSLFAFAAAVLRVLLVLLVAAPRIAAADVPSPTACNNAGETCNTAGPNYNQTGVCVASTCSRMFPGADGHVTAHEYACNNCELPATATPPITTPSATSNGAPVPTVTPSSASQKSGCNLASTARDDFLLGALTVGAAFVFRKRRRSSSAYTAPR